MEGGAWVQPYVNADAQLEIISATPWQNEINRLDVNGDQSVTALDVLLLVSLINNNSFPNGQLPPRGTVLLEEFYDPDGNGFISPLDVLTVISALNNGGTSGGEGEIAKWTDQILATEFDDLGWETVSPVIAERRLGDSR